MRWIDYIQIFRETFTFDWGVDVPGVSILLIAFVSNILSFTSAPGHPFFTYIMSGMAVAYLALKIWIAILKVKSSILDKKIKEKQL